MVSQLQKRLLQMLVFLAYEKNRIRHNKHKRCQTVDVWLQTYHKEQGADAVKFLLYYDVDSSDELNQQKQAYIERIVLNAEDTHSS